MAMTVRYRPGEVTLTGVRVRSQLARTVPRSVSSRRVRIRQTVLPTGTPAVLRPALLR